ncbi:putative pectin methylesterase CGR2 [Dirofilaria immitis]
MSQTDNPVYWPRTTDHDCVGGNSDGFAGGLNSSGLFLNILKELINSCQLINVLYYGKGVSNQIYQIII